MSRKKLFFNNLLVFGLGSISNKLIPFLILPVVTRLLPNTEYYGYNDILNVMISFSVAVILMGMYDIMFRMFFEDDSFYYKRQVCSSSIFPVLVLGILFSLFFISFREYTAKLLFGSKDYSNLIVIGTSTMFISSLNSIVSAPTRMQNKKYLYLGVNILSSVFSYSISIILLVNEYFLIALPCGYFISTLTTFLAYLVMNYKWFTLSGFNYTLMKKMLLLGLPLVPVFIFYWIFASLDRLMISNLLGPKYVGIYALGAKVASVSQLISFAFSSGWQYFVYSTMKDKDQVSLLSNISTGIGVFSCSVLIFIMPFIPIIYRFLFTGDYLDGESVFQYLFVSPLILMLYQVGISQFTILKKTYYSPLFLFAGIVANIICNYYLIPLLGVKGAAISTLFSYMVSLSISYSYLRKLKLIIVSKEFLSAFLLLFLYFFIYEFFKTNIFVVIVFSVFFLFIILLQNLKYYKLLLLTKSQK